MEVRSLVEDELRRWISSMTRPGYGRPRRGRVPARPGRSATLWVSDGRPVPEFLLRAQGEDAWRRWSDESFPDPEKKT